MNDTMDQGSSKKVWYIVSILVVALALWYFYGTQASTVLAPTTAVEETQIPDLTAGDTTEDISADLEGIPDVSATLDAEAASAAQAIESL